MRFVWKLSDLQIVRLHLFSLHLSLERYQNWPRLLVPWGWNLQTNHTQVSPAIVSEMMQLVPSTGSHGRWFQALQSSGWTSEATIISLRIALLLGRWWGCGYKVESFSRRTFQHNLCWVRPVCKNATYTTHKYTQIYVQKLVKILMNPRIHRWTCYTCYTCYIYQLLNNWIRKKSLFQLSGLCPDSGQHLPHVAWFAPGVKSPGISTGEWINSCSKHVIVYIYMYIYIYLCIYYSFV